MIKNKFISFAIGLSLLLPLTTSAYTFTDYLSFGDKGEAVSALQETLKELNFFTYPSITGFFGNITKSAVQAFQLARDIASSGDNGYGKVGPVTVEALNSVNSLGGSDTLENVSYLFVDDLTIGSKGENVRELQKFLNTHGFPVSENGEGSIGNETNNFLSLTQSALASFQAHYDIKPNVGFFGELTRAKISEIISSSQTSTHTPIKVVSPVVNNPTHSSSTTVAVASTTTSINISLTPPQFFTVSSSQGNKVSLSWRPVSSATSYAVKRKVRSTTDPFVVVGFGISSTNYTDTSVQSGYIYTYVITASNQGGESLPSQEIMAVAISPGGGSSFTPTPIDITAPALPTGFSVLAGDATSTIGWNDPSDGDLAFISIYRGTSTGVLLLVSTSTKTIEIYNDVPLHNNTTYYYALTATDNLGNESSKTSELSVTPVGIFNIYVDSVNGSDLNDGTSDYLAFQTLSAAQTAAGTIGSGVKIGLKKNSVWREQLSIDESNATIEAYGTGSKPLLDGSDEISSIAWSKTGGQTNVYEASVPIDVTTNHGGSRWLGVWINDTRLVQSSSLANCDSTPGSYYIASTSSSPVILYIHSTGSTAPNSDGKTYAYTNRAHGLDTFDATGVTIRGIHGRRNFNSYGSIVVGRSGSAYDIQASEGNTHNILVRANTYVENLVADEAYASVGSEIPFVYYEATPPANSTVTCVNCSVTRTSGSGTAFYGHTGGGSTFKTFTLTNPTVSQVGSSVGFNAANTDNLIITNATVSSGSTAVKSGAASTTISTLTFTPTVAGQAVMQTDFASTTWRISNVTVTTGNITTGAFFQASHASTTATITGTTYNSDASKGHTYGVRSTQTGFQLTSTQNSWRANDPTASCYSFSNSTNLSYISDFNNFQTQCSFLIGGSSYSSVAAYKTATSQDANSTGP